MPVAGAVKVPTLHAESAPFGTGTGGPKLHPVVVQSKPGPTVLVGPSGHAVRSERTQPVSLVFTLKRFTAPSGSADDGMVLTPSPSARLPQARGVRTVPLPSRTAPQSPVPAVLANSIVSGGSGSSVVVLVVVGGTEVVDEAAVVEVVGGGGVVVVVLVEPNSRSTTVPVRLAAPGPGNDAAPSIRTLPVAGMQKADANAIGCGTSCVSGPAGTPACENERQAVLPKHPSLPPVVCPGQKRPAASLSLAVPVTRGDKATGIEPKSELPSEPPGTQSAESPAEFVVTQPSPARAPRSHVPDAGVPGEPTAEQRGHGCVPFPVT